MSAQNTFKLKKNKKKRKRIQRIEILYNIPVNLNTTYHLLQALLHNQLNFMTNVQISNGLFFLTECILVNQTRCIFFIIILLTTQLIWKALWICLIRNDSEQIKEKE